MKEDKSKLKSVLQTILMAIGCISIVIAIVFLISLIVGRNKYGYTTSSDSYLYDTYLSEPSLDSAGGYEQEYSKEASEYSISNTESKQKKIGSISMLVEDLDNSSDNVFEKMQEYSATLLSSYESGEGNDRAVSITIKVVSSKFENIYEDLKDIGGEVVYASYSTDDVTLEYTDLESRLRNLEAVEEQLTNILDSATTVSDTLDVYSELTSIRSQIEVIKGQLEYLGSQVDYSYITITLALSESGMDIVDNAWKPVGVFKSALSALVELGKYLLNIVIWMLVFSPVIGIVVFVVVMINRKSIKK